MNLKGLDEKQISDELPWVNLTIFLRSTSQTDKWEEILHLRDKYVTMKILKKFDLVNVKAAITPMETKDEESFDVDVHLYRSMIGKLQVFLISMLSEGSLSMQGAKPNLGLWYLEEINPLTWKHFSDSGTYWCGPTFDKKSQ
ncbi:hypothetical protein Tco_1135281 [Tanacetum coccineum]